MKKINKQLKKKKLIYIIILLFILSVVSSIITGTLLLNKEKIDVVAVTEIDAFFMVGNRSGFAIEDEYLNFGMITPGGASNKEITLHSFGDEPVLVYVEFGDNLINYTWVSDNNFILEPHNNVTLSFSAGNVDELEFGNYTGKVKIYYLNSDKYI